MHPVLFEIPLPSWRIPLGLLSLCVAVMGAGLWLLGRRQKALDLIALGIACVIGGLLFSLLLRGRTYTLSSLPVYTYGAMLCASLVAGWYLTLTLGARDGLGRDWMPACYFITALAAFAGARLLYVLTNLKEIHSLFDLFAVRRGGLVAYGGFLGGLAGSVYYLRRQQQALLPWADVAVPSLALGLALTRIGCYLFGCDFGRPLSASAPAWLKRLGTFPRWTEGALAGAGSPAWMQHIRERGLSIASDASLPVHPTQLYEALAGFALLSLVLWVRKRQNFRGQVFLVFALGYAACRFVIEIVRDDTERGLFGPMLSERARVVVGLILIGGACALGPAQSIKQERIRYAVFAACALPAVLSLWWLRPHGAVAPLVQFSTSQWIAMFTALAAAIGWEKLTRGGAPVDSAEVPHPAP